MNESLYERPSPEQAILQACEGRFSSAYNDLSGFDHIAVLESAWFCAECIALNPEDLVPDEYNCRYAINRRSIGSPVASIENEDKCFNIEYILMETLLPKGDIRLTSEITNADIINSFLYFVSDKGQMYEYGTLRKLSDEEIFDLARRLERTRVSPDLPQWIKNTNKLPQGPAGT
jgi:hypothetical protein